MGGVDVTIYGEGQAAALGAKFIRAGDGALKDKLYDAIKRANVGIEAQLRASALSHLPRRGGLAGQVATARINVRRAFGELGVGITITADHQYDLKGLDEGGDVHPLFGNRRHWYFQHVRSGWFSDVVDDRTIPTHNALERAVKAYVSRL